MTSTPRSQTNPGLPLIEALSAVLRHRRLVIAAGVLTAMITGVTLLFIPRKYTSSASFTPQATRTNLAGLSGLAAQFGVVAPGGEGNQSPAFYADLLRARSILEPLVQTPVSFRWNDENHRASFLQFSKAPGRDSAQRVEEAVRRLRDAMGVSVVQKTGVVHVSTTTRYPALSHFLTAQALERLNHFNVETRRSQASAQRQFLEQRLKVASAELAEAEDALRVFAERNRGDIRAAPQLLTQQERLNRTMSIRNQTYGNLVQALEQAKVDEIRDTPLITIIEAPSVPARPDARGLVNKSILAFLAGLILAAFAVVVARAVSHNRQDRPDTYAELSQELAAAKGDLARIFKPFGKSDRRHTEYAQ